MEHVNLSAIDNNEIRALVSDYVGSLREDGTIGSPGKFEGEHIWTVYYWAWMLDGEGEDSYTLTDEDGDYDDAEVEFTTFTIDGTDVEAFPGLAKFQGHEIRLRTDSQGFVYTWIPGRSSADQSK